MHDQLTVGNVERDRWKLLAVRFAAANEPLFVPVLGIVGNSVTTSESGERRRKDWRIAVVSAVKESRGPNPWDPRQMYAISLGFRFNLDLHGNQRFDVENYIKPTIDAIAAGLFCHNSQNPEEIQRYDFDDSNFRYLFIQRLADAPSESEEGVAICISVA